MLDLGSMRTESASKMRRTGGGTCHEEKEAEEEKEEEYEEVREGEEEEVVEGEEENEDE